MIALIPLDFAATASMCGGHAMERAHMEAPTAEFAVKACLKEIRKQLDEAARVAKAAEACADIGNIDKAVEMGVTDRARV